MAKKKMHPLEFTVWYNKEKDSYEVWNCGPDGSWCISNIFYPKNGMISENFPWILKQHIDLGFKYVRCPDEVWEAHLRRKENEHACMD